MLLSALPAGLRRQCRIKAVNGLFQGMLQKNVAIGCPLFRYTVGCTVRPQEMLEHRLQTSGAMDGPGM